MNESTVTRGPLGTVRPGGAGGGLGSPRDGDPRDPEDDPRAEYARRREGHRAIETRLAKADRLIADLRLLVVVAGIVSAWLSLTAARFSPAWLALPLAAFLALILRHERVVAARRRAGR